MKNLTEATTTERLRILIGISLAVAGVLVLVLVGAWFAYQNTLVWLLGFGLIGVGLLVGKSLTLAAALHDLLRWG